MTTRRMTSLLSVSSALNRLLHEPALYTARNLTYDELIRSIAWFRSQTLKLVIQDMYEANGPSDCDNAEIVSLACFAGRLLPQLSQDGKKALTRWETVFDEIATEGWAEIIDEDEDLSGTETCTGEVDRVGDGCTVPTKDELIRSALGQEQRSRSERVRSWLESGGSGL